MSKRELCRKCEAVLRHDKTSEQYDPEYCSGKCRKEDGSPPYVKSAEELAAVIVEKKERAPASFVDYQKQGVSRYARRFEPEKLNWSKHVMNEEQLKQAGFRANRVPIPGDWDYEDEALETEKPAKTPNEWDLLRAEAKELGISTHAKKREQVELEIKEAKNA